MANEEQLSILKQGVDVWNKWRKENPLVDIDLTEAELSETNLSHVNFNSSNLYEANLTRANLFGANLVRANLWEATMLHSNLSSAEVGYTFFANIDLSMSKGLKDIIHSGPSSLSGDTLVRSRGNLPEIFLRGCGLSDWEIETAKLYRHDLSNDEINKALYRIYDLRATRALQISPLFISYSHADSEFVDQLEKRLNEWGVRFWRDVHQATAGRLEKQIDRAMRLNPTVLLILSKHSLKSDWVEHEVRSARALEKELSRDVLCPIALDDSWKNSPWSKRIMEQIMEYNILDFSVWKDDEKLGSIFNKLIDGLGLFYK